MAYNWKNQISNWVRNTKSIQKFEEEFLLFFENIINLTFYPERAFFGTDKNSIKVLIGHLYLGVYIHSGIDKGIGLIVEREFIKIPGIVCKPVKSTLYSTSKYKLFWLWVPNLSHLHNILHVSEIWESFRLASRMVIETPFGKFTRDREKKGKVNLTNLIKPNTIVDNWDYEEDLEHAIKEAQKLPTKDRIEKLKALPEIPEVIEIHTRGFKRNQYVIAEILDMANGSCELCKNDAPFSKASDSRPYLEVHHVIPLAEGGKDTIDNTVALCPNCHKEAHFGAKYLMIRELLKLHINQRKYTYGTTRKKIP